MRRRANSLAPLLGFHGCAAKTAEIILAGKDSLRTSSNDYDWLGAGVYFWIDSPERAMAWAEGQAARGKLVDPTVIGALIYPGRCLNLTDYGVMAELRTAHEQLCAILGAAGQSVPVNSAPDSEGLLLRRCLDCAVINFVHSLRAQDNVDAYDTVLGVFEEGPPAFPGSGFRERTHVQIAVRNTECVLAYFRPR